MKRHRKPGWRGNLGFTLMEAMLATVLMATILTSIATLTAQWLPNWNRGFERVQRNEMFALGFERLVADLAVAEFVPISRENIAPLFDGAESSVTFVRSAVGPNARLGLEIVRVAEILEGRLPVMVRTQAPFVPAAVGVATQFGGPVVLTRAPYRVVFSYAGPDRVWRNTWRGSPVLPRAVRLQVLDTGSGRILTVSTATVVHSEVPADCVLAEVLQDCLAARQKALERPDAPGNPGNILRPPQ